MAGLDNRKDFHSLVNNNKLLLILNNIFYIYRQVKMKLKV